MEAALTAVVAGAAALRRNRSKPLLSVTGPTMGWGRGLVRPCAWARVAGSRRATAAGAQLTEGGVTMRVRPARRVVPPELWPPGGVGGPPGVRGPLCIPGNIGVFVGVFSFSPP